jgi:hypothetical protein
MDIRIETLPVRRAVCFLNLSYDDPNTVTPAPRVSQHSRKLFACSWDVPMLNCAMPLLDPRPEPVPLEEVAAVLAHAAARVPGGPPAMITASGRQLAAALQDAGYRVVRDQAPTRQLTL